MSIFYNPDDLDQSAAYLETLDPNGLSNTIITNVISVLEGKMDTASALIERDVEMTGEELFSEYPNKVQELQDYELSDISITENNKTYTPEKEKEAYISATVDISFDDAPTTHPKTIIENGTYETDDIKNSWDPIEVNVNHNKDFDFYIWDLEPTYVDQITTSNIIVGDLSPTYWTRYTDTSKFIFDEVSELT